MQLVQEVQRLCHKYMNKYRTFPEATCSVSSTTQPADSRAQGKEACMVERVTGSAISRHILMILAKRREEDSFVEWLT